MKRLFFVLLLLLPVWALAAEPPAPDVELGRIEALLTQGRNASAEPSAILKAIQAGMSPEAFGDQLASDVEILAPDKATPPTPVILRLREVPETTDARWIRMPARDDDQFLELFDGQGNPVTLFWSGTPGHRTFLWLGVAEGQLLVGQHELSYGEGDDPNPPPPPPPPPPNKIDFVVIVHQASDPLTPAQEIAMGSAKWRDMLGPGKWRIVDLEELGPDNKPDPEVVPSINRAKEIGHYPVVFGWDKDKELVYEGKFPADTDALCDLIRERQ